MSDDFERVHYEVREGAAWITVNRPDKLNALDRRTVEEIVAATDRAVADDEVFALVVTGAGEKAFVAGADIGEMSKLDAAGAQEFSRFLQAGLDRLEHSPKPVVACVNGYARVADCGGGD